MRFAHGEDEKAPFVAARPGFAAARFDIPYRKA
jgi:hypothetical protein